MAKDSVKKTFVELLKECHLLSSRTNWFKDMTFAFVQRKSCTLQMEEVTSGEISLQEPN
jgi:hypothetical protein